MVQFLRKPWWVLPAEVLHGLTFAALWSATTDCGHDIAPGATESEVVGCVWFALVYKILVVYFGGAPATGKAALRYGRTSTAIHVIDTHDWVGSLQNP